MTLKNHVTLNIKGLNLARFLNEITREYGEVEKIRKINHGELVLTVSENTYKKLLSKPDILCYNIEVLSKRGFSYRLSKIFSRSGLIAGFILFTALIIAFNSFLWRIEIDCSDEEIKTAVLTILNENKISSGILFSNVDEERLKYLIETGVERISSAEVIKEGVSLKISVRNITDKLAAEEGGNGNDIIARFDCRVDSLAVISGTPLVKPGSIVKKGTVLVAGYRLDETGEKPVQIPVKAQAEIYGTVWQSVSKIFTPLKIEQVRTGKKFEVRQIDFLYFSWKAAKKNIPFKTYEIEVETKNSTKGSIIPVYVTKNKYWETKTVETILDFEACRPALEEEALNEALKKAEAFGGAVNTQINIHTIDAATRVEAVAECRLMVSIRSA